MKTKYKSQNINIPTATEFLSQNKHVDLYAHKSRIIYNR